MWVAGLCRPTERRGQERWEGTLSSAPQWPECRAVSGQGIVTDRLPGFRVKEREVTWWDLVQAR